MRFEVLRADTMETTTLGCDAM